MWRFLSLTEDGWRAHSPRSSGTPSRMVTRDFSGDEVVKVLGNKGGFSVERQRGNHVRMKWTAPPDHDTDNQYDTVPRHDSIRPAPSGTSWSRPVPRTSTSSAGGWIGTDDRRSRGVGRDRCGGHRGGPRTPRSARRVVCSFAVRRTTHGAGRPLARSRWLIRPGVRTGPLYSRLESAGAPPCQQASA